MTQWNSIDQALNFAIGEEQAAADFYTQLANQVKVPGMREALASFAQEEMKHKAKLQAIQAGGAFQPSGEQVANLKVAEYVVDVSPDPNLDYRGVLVMAMKKEKAAFKLYTDLAASATDGTVRDTFLALAQEEARHKLHFEVEYDDMLAEN